MSVYRESGFEFDFRAAQGSIIHDKDAPNDGNTFWPGVDYRVFEDNREVWVEVKSWSLHLIQERASRHYAKRDWIKRMSVDLLRDDIFGKFLGTTSYLAWSGVGIPAKVLYVVFLEPPNTTSRALLGPFTKRLRDEFKNAQARPWGKSRIEYAVVDLESFRSLLPIYKVDRL